MGATALFQRVCDARAVYNELGNTVVEEPTARFVCNPATPRVHDANLVSWVRAETDDEIDASFDRPAARQRRSLLLLVARVRRARRRRGPLHPARAPRSGPRHRPHRPLRR